MPDRFYANSEANVVLTEQAVTCRRWARQVSRRTDVEILLRLANELEARATGMRMPGTIAAPDGGQDNVC
jgi:hypothetical protein